MARPNIDILPPASITEALIQIAYMNDGQFDNLLMDVVNGEGLSAEKARLKRLAPKLGLTVDAARYVLTALAFMYTRLSRKELRLRPLEDTISDFTGKFPEVGNEAVDWTIFNARLVKLLSPKDSIERIRKVSRLRTGFLPNATSFKSMLDIRPNFSEDYTSIVGTVPVLQFRIGTDSSVPGKREMIFQLDQAGLNLLRTAVDAAETKFKTLESSKLASIPDESNWLPSDE